MRIKDGFELQNVCGEHVVLAYGEENINFSKIISLNESAAFIWESVIGKEFGVEDMVNALVAEYDVDMLTAQKDCARLVDDWKEAGLIA